MQVDTANAETKFCATCGFERPVTEFRRRYAGTEKRHSKCRTCFNEELRERRAAKRRGEFYHEESRLVRARSTNELVGLTNSMIRRFGGIDGVAARFHDYLKGAEAAGKYHLAIRGFALFFKTWIAATDPVNL